MTLSDLIALATAANVVPSDVLTPRTSRGRAPAVVRVREAAVRQCITEDRMSQEQTGALLRISVRTVRDTLDKLGIARGQPHPAKPPPRAPDPARPAGHMLAIVGERDSECGRYTDCLNVAVRYEHASCPRPCRWHVATVVRATDYMRSREA